MPKRKRGSGPGIGRRRRWILRPENQGRVFEFNKETDLDAFNSVPWKELDVELVQNRENSE